MTALFDRAYFDMQDWTKEALLDVASSETANEEYREAAFTLLCEKHDF